MDISIKALHKNILEWMAGPVGSIVMHVAIILALIFLITFEAKEKDEPIEFKFVEVTEQELEDLEDLDPPEDMPEIVDTMVPPDVDISMVPTPDTPDFTATQPDDSVMDLNIASDAMSPLMMKGLIAGNMSNRTGDGRAASIRAYGGQWGELAEAAVLRALEWLRLNQNRDGSWGSNDKEAMCGLAILTYLAHGETTSSEKYGQTVRRAIQYLQARQNDKGVFANVDSEAGTYAQAICVYAISEAYSMMRIPELRGVMERGLDVIIKGQQAKGAFDYKFAKSGRRDTSLSGWCCQAMKAAFIAGASNQNLKKTMELAIEDLKSAQVAETGRFFYSTPGSQKTDSITAVAVLSLQLLGYDQDKETRAGLRALSGSKCDWKEPPEWAMYAWYYVTQAKFHQGGTHWSAWNNQFAPQFVRNQNEDGSWESPGIAFFQPGTTGRENRGGSSKVYATTLAALSLQVYYRFLPTYKPIEPIVYDTQSSDDIKIEIF